MRIEPIKQEADPYKDLDPLQKIMRKVAIAAAFAGVFYWFVKVVIG